MSCKMKIVNNMEELTNLMKTLERYRFHWIGGENPTEAANFIFGKDFPIEIFLGGFGYSPKSIYWSKVC